MTEEEARAEAEEARRLMAEIDMLRGQIERAYIENQNLQVELETLIQNINILADNAKHMDGEVNNSMEYLRKKIEDVDISTTELFEAIDDLTKSYFTFKNLSTASKNVTQFTDEYFTKFKFFNELRRITLGYVIGLDAHICKEETMRKKVETVYLQNTEYWLAYAIMAVMLWKNDEEEAAKRALSKALSMDCYSSSLFFLLINLRFTRVDAAKKWYLSYLDRVNMDSLGKEWRYLFQAYLSGVFGVDKEFNSLVHKYLMGMLEQMESMHPDYGKKVADKTLDYSRTYIHITENEYETLRRNSPEYSEIKGLLSSAEKNTVLAIYFKKIFEADQENEENMFQRIENILYDLINAYDKDELKVIKNKRYNEMIIKAKGDLGMAQQYYNVEYPNEQDTQSLDELLYNWAFDEDVSQVDVTIKKFALTYLKKWIVKGFAAYAEDYRKKEKEKYRISIDGWEKDCDENSFDQAKTELENHYNKNRFFDTIKDKFVMIFMGMAVASIIILIITAFAFNKVSLVIGILLGLLSGFLLWRRISDIQAILRAKRENGCNLLRKALEEMKAWRELYKTEDQKNEALIHIFDSIEI